MSEYKMQLLGLVLNRLVFFYCILLQFAFCQYTYTFWDISRFSQIYIVSSKAFFSCANVHKIVWIGKAPSDFNRDILVLWNGQVHHPDGL